MSRLQTAAQDPATAPDVLTRLVRGPILWIAEMAAANPSLPESSIIEAVHQAVQRSHGNLLVGFTSNPSLPKHLMPEIIRYGKRDCLRALAEHPNADLETLTAIRRKVLSLRGPRCHAALEAIAKHPACSIVLIREVLDVSADVSVMTNAMGHSDLPSDLIDKIAKEWHVLSQRPNPYPNPTCHAQAMANGHPKMLARELGESIAAHPNTPPALLTVLAMHPDARLAEPALNQLQDRRRSNPALFEGSQAAERGLGL